MTAQHFTAWMTNDWSCLEGDDMDVSVLEDEAVSYREEILSEDWDPATGDVVREVRETPMWESNGNRVFWALTGVDAREGDVEEGIKVAEELLDAAGWRRVGDWEATTSSYIVTVEYDGDFRLDVEAAGPGETWTRVRRDEKAEAFDGTAQEYGLERLRQWVTEYGEALADAEGAPRFRALVRPQSGDAVLTTVTSSAAEMTPAAFKTAREALGLSDGWLGDHLGVGARTIRRWEAGDTPLPARASEELRALLRRTREETDALVSRVRYDPAAVLVTYPTDAAYRAACPESTMPASWHRAVVARAALAAPHVRIDYQD
ncbi:helix-turn-helix domain-containing protein [Streptomyces sp. NPDC001054]